MQVVTRSSGLVCGARGGRAGERSEAARPGAGAAAAVGARPPAAPHVPVHRDAAPRLGPARPAPCLPRYGYEYTPIPPLRHRPTDTRADVNVHLDVFCEWDIGNRKLISHGVQRFAVVGCFVQCRCERVTAECSAVTKCAGKAAPRAASAHTAHCTDCCSARCNVYSALRDSHALHPKATRLVPC